MLPDGERVAQTSLPHIEPRVAQALSEVEGLLLLVWEHYLSSAAAW